MLEPLLSEKCPFAGLPKNLPGRWGEGLTADKMAKSAWTKPRLVVQISFVEWSHAKFLGLQ
jgi:bifunctional non-homologous end joining protein LigD